MSSLPASELMEMVDALKDQLSDLWDDNQRVRARVAEPEVQVRTTSRNSSRPPSSDGLGKPAPKSLRRKSGRKPGGQSGHPGATLRQVADPDEVVVHEPGRCQGCGADGRAGRQIGMERRQVFDLGPIRVRVTEHQVVTHLCRCGRTASGNASARVAAPVQYGPHAAALIVCL